MSTPSSDELQLEAAVQQTPDQSFANDEALLVEMGKVSQTSGGYVGIKADIGGGFQYT